MQTALNDCTVLFLGIILEALPFVLLGSVIASVISLFVSDTLLYRIIPKNRFGGLLAASMLGIIFPVCDCTIIPIMRRLIRKGLPTSLAVTFMCAVPIVNPSVILSTYWAFTNQPQIVWLRIAGGLLTAIAAGFIIGKVTREADPVRELSSAHPHVHHDDCCCKEQPHEPASEHVCTCAEHGHDSQTALATMCACGSTHGHEEHLCHSSTADATVPALPKAPSRLKTFSAGIGRFFDQTTHEFIDSAALIIIGALLSAILQIMIPRTLMYPVASSPAGSVTSMMAFTWVISLCANADAFVAKSFHGLFTTGSVVVFMIFGQMIDLKNTIVMLGFFKKRFVLITITVLAILCFTLGVAINLIGRVI